MKIGAKIFVLLTVSLLTFVGTASAQLITYQTQTAYQGSSFTFSGGTLGQTFSNVSAVKSVTYNFLAGSGNGNVSTATALSATFGQWNGSSFVAGSSVSFGTINVPASNSGNWTSFTNAYGTFNTYAYTFDLTAITDSLINATYGYLTDSTKTYALMLTDTTGGTNLALGLTNTDAFAYGATNYGFNDWTFAQIVVAPGSQQLVPVPEAGAIASIAAGLLVAGLAALRIRQRRAATLIAAAA